MFSNAKTLLFIYIVDTTNFLIKTSSLHSRHLHAKTFQMFLEKSVIFRLSKMLTWCMGAVKVLYNGCEQQRKKNWKMRCLRKMVNLDDAEFPYILRMALSCD